ncbi:MAG: hypothetical protein V3V28_08595 [Polaribacter sp.]|uniref:hypothetical protein n=1 Tax=Polaribacter sp. TaxID=1920175 RepID=UPI002F35DBBD
MSNIQEYKEKQIAQKESLPELTSLDSSSKVSIWSQWFYIVGFVANSLKELFTLHKTEIQALIKAQKITNIDYYRTILFAYRDGHTFSRSALEYSDDYTANEIAAAQIIKRVAVQALKIENRLSLFVKIATEDANGKLTKIDEATLTRIENYVFVNSNAVQIEYFSDKADDLRIELDVYIDNTILSSDGVRIDGTSNTPVADSITTFLADKNFKFDGEIVLSQLVNAIQKVDGIESEAVRIVNAEASYQTPASWETITERYTARSGYYDLTEENLKINYLIKE